MKSIFAYEDWARQKSKITARKKREKRITIKRK